MLHIVLYQPEIPQNTGNIFRSAQAIGARVHIIKPISFSLDEKAFLHAGMDYIKDVDLVLYENEEEFFKINKDKVIYYVTRYSQNVYSEVDYSSVNKDIYFMFGKESTGIPHHILKEHKEMTIRIPMNINSRSLNLSNCVSIVLYECLRQLDFLNLATSETIKGENFLDEE